MKSTSRSKHSACKVCRSKVFKESDNGSIVCANGHVVEGFVEVVSEHFDLGKGAAIRKRINLDGDDDDETSLSIQSSKENSQITKESSRVAYLQIFQKLLRLQMQSIGEFWVPLERRPEFEEAVRRIWMHYLCALQKHLDQEHDDLSPTSRRIPPLTFALTISICIYALKSLAIPCFPFEFVRKISSLQIPFFHFYRLIPRQLFDQIAIGSKYHFIHVHLPTVKSIHGILRKIHSLVASGRSNYSKTLHDLPSYSERFFDLATRELFSKNLSQVQCKRLKFAFDRIVAIVNGKRNTFFLCNGDVSISFAAIFVFLIKYFDRLADEAIIPCTRSGEVSGFFSLLLHCKKQDEEAEEFPFHHLFEPFTPLDSVVKDLNSFSMRLYRCIPAKAQEEFNILIQKLPKTDLRAYIHYEHDSFGEYHNQFSFLIEKTSSWIGTRKEKLLKRFISLERTIFSFVTKQAGQSLKLKSRI